LVLVSKRENDILTGEIFARPPQMKNGKLVTSTRMLCFIFVLFCFSLFHFYFMFFFFFFCFFCKFFLLNYLFIYSFIDLFSYLFVYLFICLFIYLLFLVYFFVFFFFFPIFPSKFQPDLLLFLFPTLLFRFSQLLFLALSSVKLLRVF
jgi:hypothetical protein